MFDNGFVIVVNIPVFDHIIDRIGKVGGFDVNLNTVNFRDKFQGDFFLGISHVIRPLLPYYAVIPCGNDQCKYYFCYDQKINTTKGS